MPTPLGHSLAGLAVWAVIRKPGALKDALTRENAGWAGLCASMACLPDLDFISISAGGIKVSEIYHHGVTHSAGFAAIMGGVIALWAWLRQRASSGGAGYFEPNPLLAGVAAFLCVLSHAVMDMLGADINPINGIGVPILWPITSEYYIYAIFGGVDRGDPFSSAMIKTIARETAIYGSVCLIAIAYGRSRAMASPDIIENAQETGVE